MKLFALLLAVCFIAMLMTMTGRGGGNFYALVLVMAGQAMHQAATIAQFILMLTAIAGTLVFQKKRMVDWKLAFIIDPPTDIMALAGGFFSEYASSALLKFILAGLLVFAGLLMLINVTERPVPRGKKFGYWEREFQGQKYIVNLWLTIPVSALAGLAAGAVGISCGSFKVPLMVILCGVPMRIAVGTSSAMIAATAVMGFSGHAVQGHFEPTWAVPLGFAAALGGMIGGRFALQAKPDRLKRIFAYTTLLAAFVMVFNAIISQ